MDVKIDNLATLNVRGISEDEQRLTLVEDAIAHRCRIMAVTETHIPDKELEEEITIINEEDKEQSYILYSVNKEENEKHTHGVGFLIEKDLSPKFKRISDRIATAKIELKERSICIIAAYAPTQPVSEANPTIREEFYECLDAEISRTSKRDFLFIMGDFNAKTGSLHSSFPEEVGRFGKGHANRNGKALAELCMQNELFITNTMFQHKLTHRTTWEAPMRPFTTKDGTQRRNPIRNMIDYIITRKNIKHTITNSRSYGGIGTDTDHKMVKTKVNIAGRSLYKRNTKKRVTRIATGQFSNMDLRKKYEEETSKIIVPNELTVQEKWDTVVNKCKDIGKNVLGTFRKTRNDKDQKLLELSNQKKKIRNDIQAHGRNPTLAENLRETRKEIRTRLREVEEEKIDEKLKRLENTKDDSSRYFYVMKEIHGKEKKKPLKITDKDKLIVTGEQEQAEIITTYFEKLLAPDKNVQPKRYQPKKMETPFNKEEIKKSSSGLKNGKGVGVDDFQAEYIKYASENVHKITADILNTTAETGEIPKELNTGLLLPLQKPKPKKTDEPCDNLRPIMLLSVLRKILTITLLNRIWDRLSEKIPKEQAAYQPGRSTSEQVLATKILAEKCINTSDQKLYLALFDMSKAFDTVNREKLFEYLEEILTQDELHILSILTNTPKIHVKVGSELGRLFITLLGIMQGDCLSAILFIFYLARVLKNEQGNRNEETETLLIKPKYADDITYVTDDKNIFEKLKQETPILLEEGELKVNHTKTELFEIPKPPPPPPPPPTWDELVAHKNDKICWSALDWLINYKPPPDETPDWENCKLLGSYLGTKKDIRNRKKQALQTLNKYTTIFDSKLVSNTVKLRTFGIYISSVFLYNSELWGLSENDNNKIDAFQRRLLRKTLGIKWPRRVSNNKLYIITKAEKWSSVIKRRRFTFLGHILRLHHDTPVKQALRECFKQTKKKRGRPPTSWIRTIQKDLTSINITINIDDPSALQTLETLASDRKKWNLLKKGLMQ